MNEVNRNSTLGSGSDTSQTMRILCSGKPYLFFSTEAKILDCNEAFLKLTGINRNELLQLDLTLTDQNRPFIDAIEKAAEQGISIFRGEVLFGKGDTGFNFDIVLFNIIASDDKHTNGIICYILASEVVAHAEPVFEGISSISGQNIFPGASVSIHAFNGQPIYVSPSIETLLGYSGAELKELPPLYTVYAEDRSIIAANIEKLSTGQENVNSSYRMVHKNGSIVHVETSSFVINDESGFGKHIVNVTWDLTSQAKIKRALEFSEQKYYSLVMNLATGVSLISKDGKLMEANSAMKKIMGLTNDSPLPEINFFEFDSMKSIGISDQLKKCIQSKEIINGDFPYKSTRTGSDVFLSYSFLPILSHDGCVDTVIGYVSDLSRQKKVESDSRERTDFLNLVINAIKYPFFVKDEEHKWVMLNDAAVEMMGQPRESLIGKSDHDLYPKKQADVFWKYDEHVLEAGSSSNEEQISWSDGTVRTVLTHKQLYTEKPTGKKFIVGTIHDVSGYKKIEEDLRASELKYHELFDNANDFIITTDLDGHITNANRTLLTHLNLNLEQITNLNVYDFVSEENKELAHTIKDKLLNGLLDSSFEISALGIEGQPVTYEVKVSLINNNGEPVGIQCVFSDVTQKQEARMKLEKYNHNLVELNKTKDKFFSIIAHDLRNPYSSIIGFSELLLEDLEKLSKDEIRQSLKIIHNAAKNSLNLLENLLAWSRLETGRMPFDPVRVVLTSVVDEVVNVLFSLAYRKKIEINNLVESNVVLYADKNMLNTILNNLIMNSIKFTPIGGQIIISANPHASESISEKDFIKISIVDTGVGMEADVREKLFTSNKPASSLGTAKEEGTGLGLMLSREMVEKHGGIIMVESTPGKGSVFSFLIPSYKPEE